MSNVLHVEDQNTGDLLPLKLEDNGDDTYSLLLSTQAASTAVSTTATIAAAGQTVEITVGDTHSNWSVQVTGSFTGLLRTEASLDGSTFVQINYRQSSNGGLSNRITVAGLYRGNLAGLVKFRVRAETLSSGTPVVIVRSTAGIGAVFPNTFMVTQSIEQYYASTAGGNVLFDATTGEQSLSNSGGAVALLRNPSGSGVDMYIARLNYGTNGNGVFRRYRGPTVTNVGTAVTPGNRGGGSNTPSGLFYTLPNLTVSAAGNLRRTSYVGAYSESRNDHIGNLILRPGQDFYWTYTPAAAQSNTATVEVVWWETGALT